MKIDQLDLGNISHQNIILKTTSHIVGMAKYSELILFKENDKCFIKESTKESKIYEIESKNKKDQQNLDKVVTLNLPKISFVIDKKDKEKELIIQTHEFIGIIKQDIDIALNEEILTKSQKTNNKLRSIDELGSWLADQCILNSNKIFSVIKNEKKEDGNSFIILGRTSKLFIKKKLKEEKELFYISKITRYIGKNDNDVVRIIEGKIRFCDESVAGRIKAETEALLDEINSSEDSYLKIWQNYQKIETDIIISNLRNFGSVRYKSHEVLHDGTIRFDLHDSKNLKYISDNINIGDRFEVDTEPHLLIEDLDLDWKSYSEKKQKKGNSVSVKLDQEINPQQTSIFVKAIDINSIPSIPINGFIYLSIAGDESRIKRRDGAMANIMQAKSPMVHLPLIIEGKSPSIPKKATIEPLSKKMCEKIFPIYPPTTIQEKAISIALNTPDIAIIQGPPGTGKTTVITAIIERLNEINNNIDEVAGNYLISGFQHDAVENAIGRINVNGLPTPKFGLRGGEIEDSDLVLIESEIEDWRLKKVEILQNKIPNIREENYYKEFSNIMETYILSPGDLYETRSLLEKIKSLLSNIISNSMQLKLKEKILDLNEKLLVRNNFEIQEILKNIWRIPDSKIAYDDDGQNVLMESIIKLKSESKLLENEEKALKSICLSTHLENKDFDILKRVKRDLLIRNSPKEDYSLSNKSRKDIVILLQEIKDELEKINDSSQDKVNRVISEYFNELENNPMEVKRTIYDYGSVYGATCQQALGSQIKAFKNGKGYDSVIVDEAARSNPLDLFIPMSLAKNRIILVGDHRQLPHIVDTEIENLLKLEMSSRSNDVNLPSIESIVEEKIKESLFQHLFKILKDLEKKDNIKRTITLDTQYRMHPVQGDFISKIFYESNDEPNIKSGLPVTKFSHNLPDIENKAVVWLEVLRNKGEEVHSISKCRTSEAKSIAKHLKKIFSSNQGKKLKYGIITFYRAQVNEILKALAMEDIAEQVENKIALKKEYSDCIKVGTVDSFQGREFDVVYLSIVRSNKLTDDNEIDRRKKYGFLTSSNRLNVGMSRQKKLLIVAGDSEMLKFPNANKAILPLIEYYKLCQESEYGAII